MERREIYFNYKKARIKLVLVSLLIIPFSIFFLSGMLKFISVFILIGLFYVFRKMISKELQLAFDKDEIYFGFDSKKTYKRDKIKSIKITYEVEPKVGKLYYMDVVRYVRVRGKVQTNMQSYPINHLQISNLDLQMLIDEFLGYDL